MKMIHKKYFYTFISIVFFGGLAFGQNHHLIVGNKWYDQRAYLSAIPHYKKALKNPELSADERLTVLLRMSECYLQKNEPELAFVCMKNAATMSNASAPVYFRYADLCRMNGKYEEAKISYDKCATDAAYASRAADMAQFCATIKAQMKDSAQFRITSLPFNTRQSDICGVYLGTQVIFASNMRRGFFSKHVNWSNGQLFYDLYSYSLSPAGKKSRPKAVKKLSGKFHDGPVTFASGDSTVFLTRSLTRKIKSTAVLTVWLELAQSQLANGKWTKPVSISEPGDYSTAHCALSPDGNTMVYASDRPGGQGGTDLYISRKSGQTWSSGVNLGAGINSIGNEMFPVIHQDGTLWFSSDGYPGYGGIDIFYSEGTIGNWAKPLNAGYPLNSSSDDFGLSFEKGKPSGMFTSNRAGGSGNDDIYKFTRKVPVTLIAVDNVTNDPGASLVILDGSGKETKYNADEKGELKFLADYGKDFQVTASAVNFITSPRTMVGMSAGSPMGKVRKEIALSPDNVAELIVNAMDATTGNPLPAFSVEIIPQTGARKSGTGASGVMKQKLELNNTYSLLVKSPGYKTQLLDASTLGKKPGEQVTVSVSLIAGSSLIVEGHVIDIEMRKPMEGTNIRALNPVTGDLVSQAHSRKDGLFWMILEPNSGYHLLGTQADFFSSRLIINPPVTKGDTTIKAVIEMIRFGEDKLVASIYYDYNKADITVQAAAELQDILWFMNDNPETKVEFGTHTDSRGGNDYNQKLSQERSESLVTFVKNKGIAIERMSAKGYGEEKLVNRCKDDVECSESEHAKNRRAELRVVGLNMK
jgi:outer membrane protein OmpA-like peptidoglycan-associated protein